MTYSQLHALTEKGHAVHKLICVVGLKALHNTLFHHSTMSSFKVIVEFFGASGDLSCDFYRLLRRPVEATLVTERSRWS